MAIRVVIKRQVIVVKMDSFWWLLRWLKRGIFGWLLWWLRGTVLGGCDGG